MSRLNNRVDGSDADVGDIEQRLLMLRPADDATPTPAPDATIELGTNNTDTAIPGPQSPRAAPEKYVFTSSSKNIPPNFVKIEKTAKTEGGQTPFYSHLFKYAPGKGLLMWWPPTSRPVNQHLQKGKQQFAHMTSKIQIIPNNRQGQLNTTFLATLPGVLKLAEICLCFVAFILAICSDRRSTSAAWTDHITFECLVVVSALLLGYVAFPHLTLKDEPTREGLIVVELLFYGVNTVFYFIAVFLMIHVSASWTAEGRGAAVMGAIICVALVLLFAIETLLKFKAWKGENEPSTKIINTGAPTIPGQSYSPNAELHHSA
uniref:MARVEL domain-containing protein n=1 Tax=Panagrellus redivivus TaxID=6233 RepID=A0A7E4V2W1_PANRE